MTVQTRSATGGVKGEIKPDENIIIPRKLSL